MAGERGIETVRSVLYFDPDRPKQPYAGAHAIERYVEHGEGRFLQSLKSYLPSRLFQSTMIFGARWSLEQLIGAFLRELDVPKGPVVVGRPVRFVGAETPEDDARAEERLRGALKLAGLEDVVFEYEPVGAAYHYAARLKKDELVLIADFGGGTSDFCLARVGPSAPQILGTAGVGIAGDAFDGQLVRNVVAPRLGKDSTYRPEQKHVALPSWIFGYLERWHLMSFLKTRETLEFVRTVLKTSSEPERIEALLYVVESDLGLALYRAVEATKIALSNAEKATFSFHDGPVQIDARVTRAQFEKWIAPDVATIAACVDGLVKGASVDRVFMTGGTALVPAVRRVFADRFGADRLAGGEELTSVASGLALRARDLGRRRA